MCDIKVEWHSGVAPTTGTVSLFLTDTILGCPSNTAFKTVEILRPLEIWGLNEVCFGAQEQYIIGNNSNDNFVWEITNGVIAGGTSNTITATSVSVDWNQGVGVGIVKATTTNPNFRWCEKTVSYIVTVLDTPQTATGIIGETLICPGETYVYSAIPSNANSGLNTPIVKTRYKNVSSRIKK